MDPGLLEWFIPVQWPLTPDLQSSGSSSSSSSRKCQCRSATCHVCTPPLPVTQQQLRLVLEVVCLTWQECSAQAAQAQVLMALLLQRASPDIRAEFLNSADGVRLLVALQQLTGLPEVHEGADSALYLYRCSRSLSLPSEAGSTGTFWGMVYSGRAACCLAWSFLQAEPGAAAAAAAAAPPNPDTSGGHPAPGSWLTAEAVRHGSVLGVCGRTWESEYPHFPGLDQQQPCLCVLLLCTLYREHLACAHQLYYVCLQCVTQAAGMTTFCGHNLLMAHNMHAPSVCATLCF
jgi:hypothetical protein